MSTEFAINAFVGDGSFIEDKDPYEAAVHCATEQAQIWLDRFSEDGIQVKQVVSTQTQTLAAGEHVTCIISMVVEWEYKTPDTIVA